MVEQLKPTNGGFQRNIRTTWFIIEFLKGHGPEDSQKIDPDIGAPMTDIHVEYKNALLRAHARDVVDLEMERLINKGLRAYSEEVYNIRLQYFLNRIPYKLFRMRYPSFTKYFGHLKRLGWVEETGKTEPSTIQDSYPAAPPRVFYRLTQAGWKATPEQIADPVQTLYHYSREQRSAKRHSYYKA